MATDASTSHWNHNTEYHRLVLDAVTPGAETALDVGAGDGLLARDLAARVPAVTAIDLDASVVERARRSDAAVDWVCGDFMEHPFADSSFDIVASVATLHHFDDPRAALQRMAGLVAPGGALVVIGLARSTPIVDLPWDVLGVIAHRLRSRARTEWEHTAPTVWPPKQSYSEVRAMARTILPGSRFRRLALWRYAIAWHRPPA